MEAEILKKMKVNKVLTKEEINYMVTGYNDGKIDDKVMGKFLMNIKNNGLSYEEVFYLTDAMIKTGEILSLDKINRTVVDKHSTGGVGDKVTIILSPIIASSGLGIAKMSGRSLGFTGGTIDKLESIPGYKIKLTDKEFINAVNKIGVAVISQTSSLAPADKKIYALRDEIGAVESIPLIASSIMSKKIASGAKIIVIDLKVGEGAFMKNIRDAKKLAKYMIEIGKYFDRKVVCILTRMDSPLGYTVGNVLEVREAVDFFNGIYEPRLKELILTLSSYMIHLGKDISLTEARKEVNNLLKSGKAKFKFKEWITNQKGDLTKLKFSNEKLEIYSNKSGYITKVDPLIIASLVQDLGAGRIKKEDKIDLSVGIKLNKTVNNKVKKGELLGTIYYNKEIPDMEKRFISAFKIRSILSSEKDIIIEEIM